jgi:hypothetical protein
MVKIGISIGELIDKITILRIKSRFTDSPYVKKELEDLEKIASTLDYSMLLMSPFFMELIKNCGMLRIY